MVTAKQIADWAATAEARSELPRLIRRLCLASATVSHITAPAGDSTSSPGFDGELDSEHGSPWVPKGRSCWEMSCREDVSTKANEDYAKRTAAMSKGDRVTRTYVTVTARKWSRKGKWRADMLALSEWADVRAYDADDLEHWLEQSPVVAVAFAEELGLAGPGVTSLSAYLSSWGGQCQPPISASALLGGRERERDQFLEKCGHAISGKAIMPVPIKGDSVEEAVAFVAACSEQEEKIDLRGVIVTDSAGWRFVEKNAAIRVAVAARPEMAVTPPNREGLVVVVPYASGDMSEQFAGVAGRLNEQEIKLDRPDHSEFEKALQQIGMDESESRREADLCGRSWSVFRRQHAINPAIRRPAWLDQRASQALATICLIGTWSSRKDADKDAVARVAGRPYDELERDLLELERLDDSPLLHIGDVWKAKSALELLALFGDRITDAEIDRFFAEATAILSAPDPQLDLPKTERHAAAIHRKTRPISGLLLKAVCDTLIKLAVRGPSVPGLGAQDIGRKVDLLVRELLRDADVTRWLSLSAELPPLAEASPDEFLTAVVRSLGKPDSPVRALLMETDGAGVFGGRCWHAGLLWALEIVGWAPARLTRVSLILARLTDTKIAGNWANTPARSLLSFYRSWLPQTAATLDQRIQALDVLIARDPVAAAALLDGLTYTGYDLGYMAVRPKWRDDDTGAGYGASPLERQRMITAAADRQLQLAHGNAKQVAALVRKFADFDNARRNVVLELLNGLVDHLDEEKEAIRAALRSVIHWHRNFNKNQETVDELLSPLEAAYERLAPADLVIRNAWLFKNAWLDLPVRHRDGEHDKRRLLIDRMRAEGLAELYGKDGWAGVVRLAEVTDGGWQVGRAILDACVPPNDIMGWLAVGAGDLAPLSVRTSLARGMLSAIMAQEGQQIVGRVLKLADAKGHDLAWKVRFLTLAPEERATWTLVDELGTKAHELYWSTCSGSLWLRDDLPDKEYALRQLIEAARPVTALRACHTQFKGLDPHLVIQMLDGLLSGVESNDTAPERYDVQAAISYVEASEQIDRIRLAQIEFGLFEALEIEDNLQSLSLYIVLMAQPEIFVELICILYNPTKGKAREGTEAEKAAARNAWRILDACVRQPGTAEDGSVSEEALSAFVYRARELAAEQDRLEPCDSQLGQIMARGPVDEDGIFPFKPARDPLEAIGSEEMLDGFIVGCFNKRGISSRGAFDGGEQERDLASSYRANAKALEITHSRVSAALEHLAQSYDRDGSMQDRDAALRREGLW